MRGKQLPRAVRVDLRKVRAGDVNNKFNEKKCLQTNPFEGDFGSPGDRVLKDKISTARKGGLCGMCLQEIVPRERVRVLVAVFDGGLMSYRWCSECCAAMAASWTDDGVSWELRARLGRETRERNRDKCGRDDEAHRKYLQFMCLPYRKM